MPFKIIYISVLIFLLNLNQVNSKEITIITKVNNEIITNIDIENEKKYLLLLNKNLSKISETEIFDLAKNSLIREKIKKKEIDRVFIRQNDKVENKIIKNFYNRLGFNKEKIFIEFLKKKKLNLRI